MKRLLILGGAILALAMPISVAAASRSAPPLVRSAPHTIMIYNGANGWAFDDASRGIVGELLVTAGTVAVLQALDPSGNRMPLTFSDHAFRGAMLEADYLWPMAGGSDYLTQLGTQTVTVWLCHVLLAYFVQPPLHLFVGELSSTTSRMAPPSR